MAVPTVQLTAVTYLRSRGLSKDAAVAVAAVGYAESELSPKSQGVQGTEHGGVINRQGAFGAFSWNGPADQSKVGDPKYDRQADLAAHAKAWNVPVDALETQLHFALTEMANHYKPSWMAINSVSNYGAIIEVLVANYEVPANVPAEIAKAKAIASELYAAVPSATPPVVLAPPAGPAPTTGVPTMDPATSAFITQVVESLAAGFVKALLSHILPPGAAVPAVPPVAFPTIPMDAAVWAKLIAEALAAAQGGVKP